jgi:hypothetical protein
MASEAIIMKLDAKELMSELREEMRQVFEAGYKASLKHWAHGEGIDAERQPHIMQEAWLEFEKETFGDA